MEEKEESYSYLDYMQGSVAAILKAAATKIPGLVSALVIILYEKLLNNSNECEI